MPSRGSVAANYNRLSRWYDLLAAPSERKGRQLALQKLAARDGERVLEIGFGTGHGLSALARAVGPAGLVCGVDLSRGMLGVAQRRIGTVGLAGQVALQQGDGLALPFKKSSFDAVLLSFVLELFEDDEIPLVLGECRRVLRREGRLGIVALLETGRAGFVGGLYAWAHRHFPSVVDCRPIEPTGALEAAGLPIGEATLSAMWGIPIVVIVARPAVAG